MLFNSLEYLLFFLPLVWIVFRGLVALGLSQPQLLWLVACSLFFYASWNPAFILLMVLSVVVNYGFGRALGGDNSPVAGKTILTGGVIFNLGLLAYFKYTGFFLENLNALAGSLIPIPDITLPLAISFFTFQQIAYLVDVHRNEAKEYSFIHYCLFVTFFPQLVAGPIVHHKEMMPQFEPDKVRDQNVIQNLQVGTTIIFIGLFKKVILADNLALISDPLFARAEQGIPLSFSEAWIAVTAFTGQIYFDFSGYTDIAIGSARLFGIKLPENFFSPYKARNIIEFWRRWHITLSRFLRDYLYISLGGNRSGKAKRYRNLLLTMLLGGLWHGAHWNFVIWGALHGLYLVINHFWHFLFPSTKNRSPSWSVAVAVMSHTTTLLAVMVAWVFFRAETTGGAMNVLSAMTHVSHTAIDSAYLQGVYALQPGFDLLARAVPFENSAVILLTFLCTALAICVVAPNTQQFMANYEPALVITRWEKPRSRFLWKPSVGFSIAIAAMAFLAVLGIGSTSEFIYFQF